MTIQTDSLTEIIEALDFVPEIPCESEHCKDMQRGVHPAAVFAFWSCSCVAAICERRLLEYMAYQRAWCPGCLVNPTFILRTVPIGGSK